MRIVTETPYLMLKEKARQPMGVSTGSLCSEIQLSENVPLQSNLRLLLRGVQQR